MLLTVRQLARSGKHVSNLGVLLYRMGDLDEAETWLRNAATNGHINVPQPRRA
ncbi:hypothetical protein ACFWF3_31940 [Nocardia sp. NPDC060220]|uniref:hypothetical protein n=1 Tax=Nocardia sp. NPDC060220 TaxID=3347076 RepID=UPI003669BEF2